MTHDCASIIWFKLSFYAFRGQRIVSEPVLYAVASINVLKNLLLRRKSQACVGQLDLQSAKSLR